jgi:hypothetical protein
MTVKYMREENFEDGAQTRESELTKNSGNYTKPLILKWILKEKT